MRLLLAPLSLAALMSPLPPACAEAQPAALAAAVSTAPARPVSLERAIQRALADSADLAAARLEVEAAEAARGQAGARPNPVLGLEVEDTRAETRTTTLLLSQPIELGGKRAARLGAAERAHELAQARLAAQRDAVRTAVTAAYFDALLAQERVRLAQASLALSERGSLAASRRVIAGKISPVEETRARVAESAVRIEWLQARGELRAALHALNAAMGAPPGSFDGVLPVSDEPPVAATEEALEARLAASPALRQAQLEAERLRALAGVERARRTPDLTVSVGARRSEDTRRDEAVVGVSVPLPLFDTNRGAEREALKRHEQALAEVRALALRLRSSALQARERVEAARAELGALRHDVLPGAQSAHDAAVKGFELGKFGFLDVLDAQRTLLQARAQQLRALADVHRSALEIDRLLGPAADTPAPRPAAPRGSP